MAALVVLPALAVLAASAAPAHAARQRNGPIAISVVRGSGTSEDFATRIVTMRPDGSRHRVLPCAARYEGDCFDTQPDYSNDGRRMVTLTEAPEFAHAAVRTRSGRVLSQHLCDCANAVWSRGRRYLAFARGEVALLDLGSGRERRRLRMGKPGYVAWSRQGTLVAEPTGFDDPFVVREPGGRRGRVRAKGEMPEWAPDGRRFAYICRVGACVVDKNGRNRRVLPRGRLCETSGGLAWSPDGRKVACFSSDLDSSSNDRYSGVIVIDLRSRRVRSIAPNVFQAGSIDWAPRVWREVSDRSADCPANEEAGQTPDDADTKLEEIDHGSAYQQYC